MSTDWWQPQPDELLGSNVWSARWQNWHWELEALVVDPEEFFVYPF